MNIIITGASGFLGYHLSQALLAIGANVYGIDIKEPSSDLSSNPHFKFFKGEVSDCNLQNISKVCSLEDISVIYHLAGSSSVYQSELDPKESFELTVRSACAVFDWCRINKFKGKIITSSSAAVYGVAANRTLKESSSLNPYSVYGHHKLMVEQMSSVYRDRYSLNIYNARIFSIYGNGLRKQIFWDFCNKIEHAELNGENSILVSGTGEEKRDWIHVDDVVADLIVISRQECCPEVINVGNGHPNSVKDILNQVLNYWGKPDVELNFNNEQRVGDPLSLVADVTIKRMIKSAVSDCKNIDVGIKNYIEWFKNEKK